ncbi:glycosyltransferase family 4 protein [Dyella caseinilytica]|uniref:Glycosyltransferase family 4 protein n=1 Tax=Dyella caseinilytica TaxID=1849581 RepID=A0ABX7GT34_9GAMM|nr:glycosyltransferase family 4 protein [Dyella caseinilytica]QRN53567.1 glycosyltransferase family 4 protein [Dyella caseinilytica]GFZ87532.1 glycosyl transferase [Dyella caseinilytica]
MKRIKVLLFSKYSRRGPSSRLRSLQYLPLLREYGIDVQVHALFPDEYLEELYRGSPSASWSRAWWHGMQRIMQLLRRSEHDLAWIEGELFPYLPSWIESALARSVVPYVVDYDDALFHKYDLSHSPLVRRLLGRKIDQVMRSATCVIAGNGYLAARALQAGAMRIAIIPTVVDEQRYTAVSHKADKQPVIGWIGSPSTEHYMLDNRDVLDRVCAKYGARLLLIGPHTEVAKQFSGVVPEVVAWSEDSEAAMISRMDIGIMPLRDGPWERGKCGYKIIQYMACGLPVVASAVGANSDIVRHGENGFLAEDSPAWEERLGQLITDWSLRLRMGQVGRTCVENEYSLKAQAPRLAEVLRNAGQGSCAA